MQGCVFFSASFTSPYAQPSFILSSIQALCWAECIALGLSRRNCTPFMAESRCHPCVSYQDCWLGSPLASQNARFASWQTLAIASILFILLLFIRFIYIWERSSIHRLLRPVLQGFFLPI